MTVARIRLMSNSHKELDAICDEMRNIADRTGVRMRGPVHLPTRKLVVPTRKSPCGEGTQTWEKYEMRIHKRLIDIDAEERTMRQIIRLNVSRSIFVEIELMN
ncbi:MAG: 30S ribosomal protein S10 [Candidatus Heimdallarchaeota archaeon LC_3]|uniref:Small ribosomal subunit protein uS10 n=1 Tax=uncultured organism TaxID=155900 RepID=A0A0F6PZQ1_9ZZZZ|nr:putative 30S ribosomal protein S10 [uncultured organism]OLS21952.1 MAG: 30S ribosomal protein S10 [Candidatus Heimdallarchaeota archaeon LC_3]